MERDVAIRRAVLHILDGSISMPVLSSGELELEAEISEFLGKHINKIQNDSNIKNARFKGENNKAEYLCRYLSNDNGTFLEISVELSKRLFDIMCRHIDIPPADLICCLFENEGILHLGILKLNYKAGFTHHVRGSEEGNINTIVKHKTLLPSDAQKIDECVLINLEDFCIRLYEKEYEINGEKDYYLSKMFLECDTDLSDSEKIRIINKAAQKINKKYFDEDFEKAAQLKKAISESLEESDIIEVDSLAREVFKNNIDVQNEYLSEIQKSGLTEKSIALPEELAAKKFQTHRIKTDTGIEINFPMGCYNDRDKIEFVNNPDGTISIIIKNVGRIVNR